MNKGQLFYGQVKQLYPGNMAEIQIGTQKLTAKLEVPLKASDSYYFQVKETEPELQLKLVSGPHTQGESQSVKVGSLLETLQLTKSSEMRKLVDFFMKQQIPITRESLLAGEGLLKQTEPGQHQEALQSIVKLASLKLPITRELFQAMMGIETKAGLQGVLDTLQQAIQGDNKITAIQKSDLQTTLQLVKQPLLEAAGERLLAQTLLTALDKTVSPELRFQAVQFLKTAGLVPAHTSLANLSAVLAKLSTDFQSQTAVNTTHANPQALQAEGQPNTDVKQLLATLQQTAVSVTKMPVETITQLQRNIQQLDLPANVKNQLTNFLTKHSQTNETAGVLLSKFSEVLFSDAARQLLSNSSPAASFSATSSSNTVKSEQSPLLQSMLHSQDGQGNLAQLAKQALRSDSPVIQSFLAAAETAVNEELSGSTIKQALQAVLSKLGVHYEAGLASKELQLSQIQDSLKPQLVALLHEGIAGAALREAAETVVSRLNGQQLQSTDSGGQQQIIMQVPLSLQGRKMDATIQWNGRMKEDGKIDPDHARVLFYLDLEALQKTVVDMQVQNKVVTLTIFNDDSTLKLLSEVLQEKLEDGLSAEGYRLSSVRFKPFQEEIQKTNQSYFATDKKQQGVDYRI
ncbi:hypothetical protein [Sporosarcina aquimarina]|uniref:Flagellar hook-length control protein-like C-terminal domain-containing protein n=1 Tax=Sporosarcina aquimarina TaxID=114975 RepID=A0ABU4FYR8_9BACL|nr:hypothetical protein [Sporosarcina aquimarina]MDW0109247.1 hypothetical protein [Sporosarcina aquimarina]